MFTNYFKIAWRYLLKTKLYALVNILGLALGMTSCLLIGIYIFNELSFDHFNKNANRIVRATMDYNSGDAPNTTAMTGTKVGPQFKRTFPQVEAYVRTIKYPRVIGYKDKVFDEKRFLYADPAFFNVFSFKLLNGNAATVLDAPDKIVLTQSMSKKYFGDENPIGKTVTVGIKQLIVSGIAADAPNNSQIKFDFVSSFMGFSSAKEEKWWEANYITYLLLHNASDIPVLQKQVAGYMKTVSRDELKMTGANNYLTYHLEPFLKVHLYSSLEGLEPNNNILYIYILGIVAILILLIACVNYTNLSTAQAAGRSAEVGMRKVMGAGKMQVFYQFICESFLLTLIAVITGVVLSLILLPYFNQLSGQELTTGVLFHPVTIISLLLLAIIVAFMAGAYPAIVLSNGKIIQVLKSGFNFTGGSTLRKTLIVFQFTISIFLIIATIVILQQLSYVRNKDLGYDKEHILVLPVDRKMSPDYDAIRAAIASAPNVVSVAGAYETPTDIGWGDGMHKGTGDNEKSVTVNAFPVDEHIVKTLGLRIIAGSDYTNADVQQFDTSNGGENLHYTYMLNESAVKALGWTPQEAIGKTITKGRSGVVKAVIKDFHLHSFHEPINPLVVFLDKRMVLSMFVKISGKDVQSTLNSLQKVWKQRVTHRPFDYHFLDEEYDAMYKTEQRTAGVFTTFASLAILLACLGLFALTAYTMVQRTKEIGIRKVLGATIPDILSLVSKDFLKLVILALVIAVPVGYYATNKWLDNFSYKISITPWVFIIAGLATIIIAFITISAQAIKTAMANPVKSLRTE
ncbi:MAG: hypothetical protein JWN76_678 [Chitinophagaceae bacterium]|nr:hypothetical protein [Chitinophagaceae bacterium]